MNNYKKYNLLKQLENELILLKNDHYIIQYAEKLYLYNEEGKELKQIRLNQLNIKGIKKLIQFAKSQGSKKQYKINYFNQYERQTEITARTRKQAELKFKRLFNCKII